MNYGCAGRDPIWKVGELKFETMGRGMGATNENEKRDYTGCSML